MSAIDPEKKAIVQELMTRIDTLDPEKRAIVQELAGRFGIETTKRPIGASGSWEEPSVFRRALNKAGQFVAEEGPAMAGGALGGALGAPLGPAGIATGAVFGGAGGGAFRQLVNRATGQPAPQTPEEAAALVTKGALSGLGQEAGGVVAPKASTAFADMLRRSSQRNVERILDPTKEGNKFITQKVKEELAERTPVALTRAGYAKKVAARLESANRALDEAWATLPDDTKMRTKPIIEALNRAKQEFIENGVAIEPDAVQRIDDIAAIIGQYGDSVSPQSLRKVRQIWDRAVSRAGGFKGKPPAEGNALFARKQGADAIRRELAKEFPDIQKVNAEYAFWSNVDEVISETAKRKTGQMGRGLEIAGSLVTGAGMLARGNTVAEIAVAAGAWAGIAAAAKSTARKSASAATKSRLASYIVNDNWKAAAALVGRVAGGEVLPMTSREFNVR